MSRKQLMIATCMLTLLAGGPAFAAKVNMPQEGSYEFNFCAVITPRTLVEGEKVFVMNYKLFANTITEPPGKAFDQQGVVCYGQFTKLNGKMQESGVCELTDHDGDKWWMDYRGNAEGTGGAYTAAHGTGKYDGMTVKGQYTLVGWPSADKEVLHGCNRNKGTYKLR